MPKHRLYRTANPPRVRRPVRRDVDRSEKNMAEEKSSEQVKAERLETLGPKLGPVFTRSLTISHGYR